MLAVFSFETFVTTYQITRCNNPDNSNPSVYRIMYAT